MGTRREDNPAMGLDAFIKTERQCFRVWAYEIIMKDDAIFMIKNDIDDDCYSVGGAF